MVKILIGAVVAAFIVVIGFLILDPQTKYEDDNVLEITNDDETTGKFSIDGEINNPGTYSFNETPTMADLIQAAGGITSNADERGYYTTYELKSGTTYYIPSEFDEADLCNTSAIQKVNINKDSAEKLSESSVITNAIATSIVSYREENGNFQCLEDLLNVYGIGNATYRKIRNYVILHE